MTMPMVVLAVGSVALGGLLAIGDGFVDWLAPVTGHAEHAEPVLPVWALIALTLLLVLVGVLLAWRQYAVSRVPIVPPARFGAHAGRAPGPVPGRRQRGRLHAARAVPHAVPGLRGPADGRRRLDAASPASSERQGRSSRGMQNGFVRSYAATMLAGLIVIVAVVLAVTTGTGS